MDIYGKETLILFFRNFNLHCPNLRVHTFPFFIAKPSFPVLGSFAGLFRTMFYIHARSSSRIFQGGGGRGWYLGVAESVGHRRGRYYFCSLVSLLYNDIFLSLFYLERQLLAIKMK